MGIFELATELGRTLKEDPRLCRLEAAKEAYEADGSVRRLTTEYEAQQRAMQQEIAKPQRDDAAIARMQGRMDELYDAIVATPAYRELQAAQDAVNELMNMVNTTITYQITGQTADGCTHDCSTCKGCH